MNATSKSFCIFASVLSRLAFGQADAEADRVSPSQERDRLLITLQTKPAGLDLRITAFAVDPKGNIIVAGTKTGPVEGETLFRGEPSSRWYPTTAFVAKYPVSGSLSWLCSLAITGKTSASAVAIDAEGNVFLVGETGEAPSTFVAKFDRDGKRLWQRRPESDAINYPQAVACDSEGNAVIAGYIAHYTHHNCFLKKYDSSGKELWNEVWGAGGYNQALAVTIAKDNSIYVAGAGDLRREGRDAFVARFSRQGENKWSHLIGTGGRRGNALGIALDGDGNIYASGFSAQAIPGKDGERLEPFVSKFDSSGKRQWLQRSKRRGFASRVCVDSNGDVFAVGEDNNDGFLLNYDKEGVEKYQETWSDNTIPTAVIYSPHHRSILVSAIGRIPDRFAAFRRDDVRLSFVFRKEVPERK